MPRCFTIIGILMLITACNASANDDSADASDEAENQAAACPLDGDLGIGQHVLDQEFDGMDRIVHLYVPPGYDPSKPMPLLFNLHPFVLGQALLPIWKMESGMEEKADEEDFIVVTPSGTGGQASWNAGEECCGDASAGDVDDTGLILHLIDYVSERVCVDDRRVYATGMSNGAYLSSRLACEASDRFAAIAPVVGHLSAEFYPCALERAMPVLQITGAQDSLVRRTEGFEQWVEMNGCTDEAEETYSDGTGPGSARCVTHDECNDGAEVTHCIVEAGHCWFTQYEGQLTPDCSPPLEFHSPDMIWDFLSRFALPEP